MKYPKLMNILLAVPLALSLGCRSELKKEYKGQIHVHTTESADGSMAPEDVVKAYADLGYEFIFITDHQKVFVPRGYYPIKVFSGAELGVRENKKNYHILGLGIKHFKKKSTVKKTVRSIRSQGGVAVLAHAKWSGLEEDDLKYSFDAFESFNYLGELVREGNGDSSELGDYLRRHNENIVGLVSDDSHNYGHIGNTSIIVSSYSLKQEDILDAIRKGDVVNHVKPQRHRKGSE